VPDELYTYLPRRGTAAAWRDDNPVLLTGQMGRETDTDRYKMGDGATAWNLLPYTIDGPGLTRLLSPVWSPAPSTLIRSFYMPSYGANDLAHASNDDELDVYVAQLPNATHACATVHVFGNGDTGNVVSRHETQSENPANLPAWFELARARGLRTALAFIFHTTPEYGWAGGWDPTDKAAAFASYLGAVQPYLEAAQAANCDFVILCDEWSLMFRTSAAMAAFATLFAGARAIYKGPLGIDVNVQEEDDVLSGLYTLCDFISVNAYLKLHATNSPSVQQMAKNLLTIHDDATIGSFLAGKASGYSVADNTFGYLDYLRLMAGRWQRPILLVAGYKSTTGAAIAPATQAETDPDNAIQANAYRAFIESAMTSLGSTILGFNFWRWHPKTTTDTTGFSPKGKTAAAVIARTWAARTPYWPPEQWAQEVTATQPAARVTAPAVFVTAIGTSPGGIILPTAVPGMRITVHNASAEGINVFPGSGAAIIPNATDAAAFCGQNYAMTLTARSATQWYRSAYSAWV
jgi:hypothetical protein